MNRRHQGSLFENMAVTSREAPIALSAELGRTISALILAYERGLLGGTSHEVYPEVPESSRQRRLYFTLAPALNYQRKSEGLWRSALDTYSDPETNFVFRPENVGRGFSAYRDALSRYRLAVQPDKQTDIWFRLSTTFNEQFDGDPENLFRSCGYDVTRIVALVSSRKKEFPYISGPKLLNYWLYMITCFTSVPLVRRDAISIVPDVHVRRATHVLGLASERDVESPEFVAALWKDVLADSPYAPVDLHAPLWRWGRLGFPSIDAL